MKKINYLTSVLLFGWFLMVFGCSMSKKRSDRLWTFNIEGIQFDSLRASFNGNHVYFEKKNDNKWEIAVIDSIYYRYSLLGIEGYIKNTGWKEVYLMDSVMTVKYLAVNSLFFSDANPVIVDAFYTELEEVSDIIILKTLYSDPEYINGRKMGHLFSEASRDELSREEIIKTLFDYIEKTPDSYALIKTINSFLTPATDLVTYKKMYALFTDDVKNTPSGKSFKKYLDDREVFELSDKIQVFDLPRCDNLEIEPFIKDDGRYKLVLFSSVGCKYCHQIIPLYKEVYNDLSDKLDMLYITCDSSEQFIEMWKELLDKHEIPWRSYYSYNIEGGILQKYMLNGIPNALLVNPDMTFEQIDIRKEENKAKLYNLIRKQ